MREERDQRIEKFIDKINHLEERKAHQSSDSYFVK